MSIRQAVLVFQPLCSDTVQSDSCQKEQDLYPGLTGRAAYLNRRACAETQLESTNMESTVIFKSFCRYLLFLILYPQFLFGISFWHAICNPINKCRRLRAVYHRFIIQIPKLHCKVEKKINIAGEEDPKGSVCSATCRARFVHGRVSPESCCRLPAFIL